MTYAFAHHPRIKKVHYNDLDTSIVRLHEVLLEEGVPKDFYNWVSREEFNNNRYGDSAYSGFLKTCWSFGSSAKRGYIESKKNEAMKKRLYNIQVNQHSDEDLEYFALSQEVKEALSILSCFQERRKFLIRNITHLGKVYIQSLTNVQHLEAIANIQDSIKDKIIFHNKDFKEFKHFEENSILYLDPPYRGTSEYVKDVVGITIEEYSMSVDKPMYLSSYESTLEKVATFRRQSLLSTWNEPKKNDESLFYSRWTP